MVHSAQDFIRALKAPSDPPQAEGLTKIEIATTAWADSSFYIPNKEEVITDWALTRLLKDKDKEPPLGTLRSTKPWLIPLLSRVPIIPIIITLLNHLSQSTSPDVAELASVASQCLSLLWPLAVPKFSADTLLDGFGAVLRVFNQLAGREAVDEDTVHLATLIVNSYTSSAANTANKKKAVYDAGIETIFNAEVLRIEESNFVDAALTQLTGEIPDVVLQCLPRLFTSYSQNTRRHRSALYGQGSNQQHGASLQHARRAAISCFASCDNLLGRTNASELAWSTRLALLRAVVAENLYIVNDETATNVLRTTGENAVEAIVMAIRGRELLYTRYIFS
ncbi:hypothetical protein EIP86_005239 [Pleurotus ostreatoroseus]|nr:hypothetical protein EIP86_005239 [Pleurotus ostreatoroseus]